MSEAIRAAPFFRSRAALSLMFFALPLPAVACDRWDVTGNWQIRQANGYSVVVELSGREGHYTGFAPPAQNRHRQGTASVDLHGNAFSMRVSWGPDDTNAVDSVGVYTGQIHSDGRISGATYDRRHPENVTTWSRAEPLKCLDAPPAPPAPAPKPIHRLGKIKPAAAPPQVSPSSGVNVRMTTIPEGRGATRGGSASADPQPLPPSDAAADGVGVPQSGGDTCLSGFVWREARASDHVCVTPESRSRVAQENRSYRSRVDANGAQGLATCKSGFVWREAFDGDVVCVTPDVRDQVSEENRVGVTRLSAP